MLYMCKSADRIGVQGFSYESNDEQIVTKSRNCIVVLSCFILCLCYWKTPRCESGSFRFVKFAMLNPIDIMVMLKGMIMHESVIACTARRSNPQNAFLYGGCPV